MKQILTNAKPDETITARSDEMKDKVRQIRESMCCYSRNASKKIVWQITDHCPLGCQYCFTPDRGRGALPIEDAVKLLHYLRSKLPGKSLLLIAGREPLLYDGLETIIVAATRLDFSCSMSTSGELLSSRRAAQLKDVGLRKVNLSINAFDGDLHERSRPHGDLSKVLKAVNSSLEVGLAVKVNVTITTHTVGLLPETIQQLADIGVKSITVGLIHSTQNLSTTKYSWQYDDVEKLRHSVLRSIPSELDFRLVIPPGPQDCFLHASCPAKKGLVAVLPDGTITGCNIHPESTKAEDFDGQP